MALLGLLALVTPTQAQTPDYSKLSVWVRQIALQQQLHAQAKNLQKNGQTDQKQKMQTMTAFVRIPKDAHQTLKNYGCKALAQFGDIYITAIPLNSLVALSRCSAVSRIEARSSCSLLMDSTAIHTDAIAVYAGENLPQAFSGHGVVMGIQDIGFDLTHPNFYNNDLTEYRIKALWDQLSTDTIGSSLYVGADYTTRQALLSYAHSRDGIDQTHGTHTLGIAAGSGYNSPYKGMAYESDICLVANATTEDISLIDSTELYKYTSATDALGFKYIFDYAQQQGKPCVISFSEGSHQDLRGDDQLYYAVLDSLTGPGRIIVASAGNDGIINTYFHKPKGVLSAGGFLLSANKSASFTMRSSTDFNIRLVIYGNQNDTICLPSNLACLSPDSQYVDSIGTMAGKYFIQMIGYHSSYDKNEQVLEMQITGQGQLGGQFPISIEAVGKAADVEWFRNSGYLISNAINPQLTAGEPSHSIHSPGSAPSVICVGANSYRTHYKNYRGEWKEYDMGTKGARGEYSSVGPTMDNRIKPDVLAPGTNVISSYSSYYLEAHPDASDIESDVEHFRFENGRTYAWNANSGTSMSAPVVGGAIALWLEANPSLSPKDCLTIFEHTCSHSEPSITYPNNYYGYGQIDVYRGLLEALQLANSIPNLPPYQPKKLTYKLNNNVLNIQSTDVCPVPIELSIYAVNGSKLLQTTLQAEQNVFHIEISNLPKGILVVKTQSRLSDYSGSTLIRH